jgi:2-polyprenyl-6-methoxyphenol hydroxylase-like FAD-dependent oxidoreductase
MADRFFFETDVLIVGAGPTGLALAAALSARRVKTILIDSSPEGAETSRATVLHARTLEVLEPLGVSERLVALGLKATRFTVRDRDEVLTTVAFDALPTRYPYALSLSQATTEATLLTRLHELGGAVSRAHTLIDLAQDSKGVLGTTSDGMRIRARFAVGTDGQYSKVRECCNLGFVSGAYHENLLLADVRSKGAAPRGEGVLYLAPDGLLVLSPLPGDRQRVIATVHYAPERPSAADVQQLLDARGPQKQRAWVEEVFWSGRFHVHHRIADEFVCGRVVLAGDAAHMHSPTGGAGGQGMNTGIQDAVTLARVLTRALPDDDVSLLAAYGQARQPIAQRVVRFTDRLTRLATVNPHWCGARNFMVHALGALPAVRKQVALGMSELNLP